MTARNLPYSWVSYLTPGEIMIGLACYPVTTMPDAAPGTPEPRDHAKDLLAEAAKVQEMLKTLLADTERLIEKTKRLSIKLGKKQRRELQ
jgi:hypothetical protein